MNICYNEEQGVFKLDTPSSSYILALANKKWLGHLYYGPRIETTDLQWVFALDTPPYTPERHQREEVTFFDCFPMEYPIANEGDSQEGCLAIRNADQQVECRPVFTGYQILHGKPPLTGLPATFGDPADCNTLQVTLEDATMGVTVELFYTAFTKLDVITRSARIGNTTTSDTNSMAAPIWLDRALSASLTLPYQGQQLITLPGSWARERAIQTQEIGIGYVGTASRRGISSHQDHPFLALASPDVTQERGEVYALHFVYSGSFFAQVGRNQHDELRAIMGIHPSGFGWKLAPGETFQTPEVIMSYSNAGLGKMTRTFHDLYRNHLIRSPYKDVPRPVLINNWEATYFDFDEERLIHIAEKAASLGIELFVLDDGWFGNRNTDSGSLGDWWNVNTKKLPHGLNGLADKINALGMQFGLWMEPEMVSMDSELYHKHPDWVIRTRYHQPLLCRDQLVLDLSNPAVETYVYQQIAQTLRSANISYLKWDMNRPLTNLGSTWLPADQQGEIGHRYVLALYRMQEQLITDFPELLLENCCSGGGRFDPGMLYYSPQIWCSDDTDAIERLRIQEGTAMLYPLSCIGAHVSDCPNHIVGRVTPFTTRGIVAMSGTFGYELDVSKISPDDQSIIPVQIAKHHQYAPLILSGDYYRLSSSNSGRELDAQMVVSKDQAHALITLVRVLNTPNQRRQYIRLQGLDPKAVYQEQHTDRQYTGEALLYIGLPIELPTGDFQAVQIELRRVKS